MPRSIQVIANEICDDWVKQKKTHPHARPYLLAMRSMHTLKDSYLNDSALSIVNDFLANAGSWRGEVARRIKNELNRMLADEAKQG